MTRLVFEHQRGHLRRERSHAMPEGFTALRPFPSHYEFAAMFAAFADLVTVHELDGTVRFASDSSREILGLAPDQLIGRPASEVLCCAEDAALLTSAIERVRGGDDTADVTFRGLTQDSQSPWLETRIGVVKGLKGSATGFVAVSRLVTDRVEARAASPDPATAALSPGHRCRARDDRLDRRPGTAVPLRGRGWLSRLSQADRKPVWTVLSLSS